MKSTINNLSILWRRLRTLSLLYLPSSDATFLMILLNYFLLSIIPTCGLRWRVSGFSRVRLRRSLLATPSTTIRLWLLLSLPSLSFRYLVRCLDPLRSTPLQRIRRAPPEHVSPSLCEPLSCLSTPLLTLGIRSSESP
ncbi:MAG: hypothetical protein [Microviridae sp.]|nr:MAG: hypothetical protein [Microviridae sp.]